MENIKHLVNAAMSRQKAQLVLKNGNVVNVFTDEIIKADVAVLNGIIVGIGTYSGEEEIDCTDKYICPGFIDGHMHIESTMVTPFEFAKTVAQSGTTTIIADPHEIVNVCGKDGMQYFLDAAENLPVDIYFMLPSSVPATAFETNGSDFTAEDMKCFINNDRVLGLGEVMCYPNVVAADDVIMQKLALSKGAGKLADGHAPGLSGKELQAYATAGVCTEHECTTFAEAEDKARAGFAVLVREGSAAKNLTAIVNGLLDSDLPTDRFLFCTDDKHIEDIKRDGHVRWNVRQAISLGMKPVTAIKMATRNAAAVYGLSGVGAVAAGYKADLVVLDSLKQVTVNSVYKNGVLIEKGFESITPVKAPESLLHSVKYKDVSIEDIALKTQGNTDIIEMVPYQIATRHIVEEVPCENGYFKPNNTYTKLCVVERHGKNGNIAVAPLKGYGITGGAIATSVAHDSHNIIAAGDNDEDLLLAINSLREIGGGYVLTGGGKVLGSVPLCVAGLMSEEKAEVVQNKTGEILALASGMGIPYYVDPFVSLSFMALPVIPEIRLSDMGLFDVVNFRIIRK
ncbi:MAG: adenine deaminase [Oscillospiraceae bacterium]